MSDITKYIRSFPCEDEMPTDEYLMMLMKSGRRYGGSRYHADERSPVMSLEDQLRSFIKSCSSIHFTCREEVTHTLCNQLDGHIIREDYRILLRELAENIDRFNAVFLNMGFGTHYVCDKQ